VGIFAVTMMAWIFPAGPSTGIYLPMLVVGDIFAVAYYHQHAEWKYVLRPLLWAVAGILAGFGFIKFLHLSDDFLRRMIGAIVLLVVGLGFWLKTCPDPHVPHRIWFAGLTGVIGGFTTMVANAAGPVWMVYLLAMNLDKRAFMGTSGWMFLILNLFKVPFSYGLGFITSESLLFNAKMIPAIALGAYLGIRTAKVIPQKAFDAAVSILAATAAVKLLF
jgi:uncharacterized membrane protein YfcA